MNQKIKELAEQARVEVRAEWDNGNKILYPAEHYAFQMDNDQKFAELIIQECGAVCERLQDSIDRQNWPTPYECASSIKKYFGIEQ